MEFDSFRKFNMQELLLTLLWKLTGNLINSQLNKRHQKKKQEEAKDREAKRLKMKAELEEVKGDINNIQGQMLSSKEEEKRLMLDAQKTSLTIENLPKDVTEDSVQHLLKFYPGVKDVFLNQATWVAVIEFDTHANAVIAQQGNLYVIINIGVNGFQWVEGTKLIVNFK